MAAGLGRMLGRADGEQGQKGEERNDRQVLQQQYAEGRPADRPLP